MSTIALRIAGLVTVAALFGTACGGSSAKDEATPAKQIKPLTNVSLPAEVLGLRVSAEDVGSDVHQARASYADAVTLFSFRSSDDLLQATLQVTRFNSKARYRSNKFRQTLLQRIGTASRLVRVGHDRVYMAIGNRQQLAIWFRGRYMFLLAEREDYQQPRALIRQALEVNV